MVLRNRLEMRRSSRPYGWNLIGDSTFTAGRISFLSADRRGGNYDFFVKVRSGKERESNWRDFLYLNQGAFSINLRRAGGRLKYFLRERVHYSRFMLIPLISSDSPFLSRNREGLSAELNPVEPVNLSYSGTRLSSEKGISDNWGMPGIRGRVATLHRISADFRMKSRAAFGVHLSEMKPVSGSEEAVMAGFRGLLQFRGLTLASEYIEKIPGALADLSPGSFRGISPAEYRWGKITGVFPEGSAFSTEITGLNFKNVDFIAGYSYSGPEFIYRMGDLRRALSENYLLAVWKHPEKEAMIDVMGGDIYYFNPGVNYSYVQGNCRVYLKKGFEIRSGALLREEEKPSLFISLTDDSPVSSLTGGLRLDEGDKISFISSGSLNLTKRWSLESRVYLYRSDESRYNISVSYFPSPGFLFRLSAGSFDPVEDIISFHRGLLPELPAVNRFIRVYARMLLGGMED
ncbi:MAG: hypothetical protein R6U43_00130 [Candidatus Krumholzibacteriales bacterium]